MLGHVNPAASEKASAIQAAACDQLDYLLAGAATVGGSALLGGEPGIGKTALLDRVAWTRAWPVLPVRGLKAESILPYAVAANLLTLLFDRHSGALPDVQRRWIPEGPAADKQASRQAGKQASRQAGKVRRSL